MTSRRSFLKLLLGSLGCVTIASKAVSAILTPKGKQNELQGIVGTQDEAYGVRLKSDGESLPVWSETYFIDSDGQRWHVDQFPLRFKIQCDGTWKIIETYPNLAK